jgi:N-acetylmuramoyl-L-alanine amidase
VLINRKLWSPNWSNRPNGVRDVRGVILHHTATSGKSAVSVANYFANPSAGVSAHFVIGEDGYTIQCVALGRAAWHAGTARYDFNRDGKIGADERAVNTHTIGIELCNKGDGKDDFPDAQVKACAEVIRYCDRKCPNLRLRNVTDHEAVNLRGKIDLRPNFPAAKLFWYIIHPPKPPSRIYAALPKWAQRQIDEIKR